MPNGPEFIESLFGILFTGAVAVPVNARFTARELGHVTRDAGLRVLPATKVQTFRLREQLEAELALRISACEPR
jgi:acyl-CoA synthetase (AMP-forming)/AMP-acid ligase II